ncbi:MAG TPA: NADH-quinone oxidoreductase subunit C [Terriglobia bacterium]|nr:NADH-quinone oxidoreductase subunit C [Terriglobia bacterium]
MASDLDTNLPLAKLRESDPEAVEDARTFRGEVTLYIRPSHFMRACEFLRDEPGLMFTFLADVTALDLYPQEPRFELVYHLLSMEKAQRLRLKVRVSGEDPRFVTAIPVWPAANAFEREVFDLFGIVFDGHPFMRRLLLPEEWEGYPLRKDYPTEGYR